MSSDLHSGAQIQLGAARIDRPEDVGPRRAATRFVATKATDADDLALLLDALGLRPEEGKTCR